MVQGLFLRKAMAPRFVDFRGRKRKPMQLLDTQYGKQMPVRMGDCTRSLEGRSRPVGLF
jgi:hypothetical protein